MAKKWYEILFIVLVFIILLNVSYTYADKNVPGDSGQSIDVPYNESDKPGNSANNAVKGVISQGGYSVEIPYSESDKPNQNTNNSWEKRALGGGYSDSVPYTEEEKILTFKKNNENIRVRTKEKVALESGKLYVNDKEVKIMPDVASQKAIDQLKLNHDVEIKLKDNGKPTYVIDGEKEVKLFCLFDINMNVETEVDADSGILGKVAKPWWNAVTCEKKKKVTICHIPNGNVNNSRTIKVANSSVQAHLTHGDYLGECNNNANNINKCNLQPETGDCKGLFPKFYFDSSTNACKEFTWGGCGGVVPFESLEECRISCGNIIVNQSVRIKNYNMAFILLANDESEITPELMNKLNNIKSNFSEEFYVATQGLATMNTSYPTSIIINNTISLSNMLIVKKFFESNPDSFDFISIYTSPEVFPLIQISHATIINNIQGIGFGHYNRIQIFDNSENFGSSGNLLGINYMGNLSLQSGDSGGLLLHETGHQWCCYVGEPFGSENARLEITEGFFHYYFGLFSSYNETISEPLDSRYWIPNGDGTYRKTKQGNKSLFHPFSLYFMGLYTKDNFDFNKSFILLNATLDVRAVPYKNISINDIIAVEGERREVNITQVNSNVLSTTKIIN